MESPEFSTDPALQVIAVGGLSTAGSFEAAAALLEVLGQQESAAKTTATGNQHNDLRLAAARAVSTGDWSEFNDLVNGTGGAGGGGDGAGGGNPPTANVGGGEV